MRGSRGWTTVALVSLLSTVTLGVSGCWSSSRQASVPAFAAQPAYDEPLDPITQPEVLEYCPAMPAVHYAGFVAPFEFVYACRAGEHRASDGVTTYGDWQVVYQIMNPHAVLEAYAEPNLTRSVGPCLAYLADPLILWVHSRGRVEAVYAPVDECGFPLDDAIAAYAGADRRVLVEFDQGVRLDDHDTPAEH